MTHKLFVLSVAGASVLTLMACGVDVHTDADGKKTVNVSSPFGGVNVKTDVDPAKTGLPVYPGARLVDKDDEDAASANVIVGAPGFGLRVVAAEMESDDAPDALAAFYRREMAKLGAVTECQGEIDMDGGAFDDTPRCRPRAGRWDFAVGVKNNFRLASVNSRSSGSTLALVHIQMGKG